MFIEAPDNSIFSERSKEFIIYIEKVEAINVSDHATRIVGDPVNIIVYDNDSKSLYTCIPSRSSHYIYMLNMVLTKGFNNHVKSVCIFVSNSVRVGFTENEVTVRAGMNHEICVEVLAIGVQDIAPSLLSILLNISILRNSSSFGKSVEVANVLQILPIVPFSSARR